MLSRRIRTMVVPVLATGMLLSLLTVPAAAADGALKVRVLSNRADLVSGGDALVEVGLPAGVEPGAVRVRLGDDDVTARFGLRENGRYQALLNGLPLGPTPITATAGTLTDQAVVTNHRNGGPVLSGPQLQPWLCQPTAVDELCNQPAAYTYLYKSSNPLRTRLRPYEPENRRTTWPRRPPTRG